MASPSNKRHLKSFNETKLEITDRVTYLEIPMWEVNTIRNRSRNEKTLGPNEQAIMLAITIAGEDAYGATINRVIEQRTGNSLSIGALYKTLERLEKKELISSHAGTKSGGKPNVHYFKVTKKGHESLRSALAYIDNLRSEDFSLAAVM